MTDLRKAAEAILNAWDNSALTKPIDLENKIEALRQALAQPEREYMDVVVAEHADGTYTIQRIPLSKREWVGLTDEDFPENATYGFVATARWAESKLKEKNSV